jgi:hypothetical protein
MIEKFKKGQLVPKRLGKQFLDVCKKHRHLFTFGADVEVERRGDTLRIHCASNTLPAIYVKTTKTKSKYRATIQNIHVTFPPCDQQSVIKIGGTP